MSVGNLTVNKNHRLILEAAARTGRTDLEVVVLGKGAEEEALRRVAGERGVPLELPGIVANEQLPGWLRSADVFLMTSHSEGHPKSLLEAMSVGLPCIGTNVRGIRDILKDGETGWLCEPAPDALASLLDSVLSDESRARRVGRGARQFVLEHYDAEVVMAREIAFLKKVASRR